MDEKIRRILGYGPYPFPEKEFDNNVLIDTYIGPGIIIISPKGSMKLPKGSHMHSSYEFLIPLNDMAYSIIDNRLMSIPKERLFPINPQQPHGQMREIYDCRLTGIQIDSETFNDISEEFCQKKDIVFENQSCSISSETNFLIKMFIQETSNNKIASRFATENLTNLIAVSFIRQLKSNISGLTEEKRYCEKENINRVIAYFHEEYYRDFSLKDVAKVANLSPYYFIRTFKLITGKTPYDFLLDIKIEKSIKYLKKDIYTLTEIGLKCGFNNLEHFSSAFKRKVGILPSQFRKNSIKTTVE